MLNRQKFSVAALLAFALPAASISALNTSVGYINGDDSMALLGDGTGVIVGVIDSGVDDTHSALTGLDSLGSNRLVAEANFTSETSTGDDVFGHGTWVASVILGDDPGNTYEGLAHDARYINARVLNANNGFQTGSWVENGVAYAVNNGADLLNLSLNFSASDSNTGTFKLDYMLDYAAENFGIASVISAGNISTTLTGDPNVRSPAGAFNVLAVGRTDNDFNQVHPDSAEGLTVDGRSKPDLVAPGTNITMANDDWETQNDWNNASGTSFAAPHVAGLLTQQIDFGNTNGYSTSPLVTKATLINSAQKNVLDKAGNPWAPNADGDVAGVYTVTSPLNTDSGAGQVDGLALYNQYAPGEQGPGLVDPVAWDLGSVTDSGFVDYVIDPDVAAGTDFMVTLNWFRHIARTDGGAPGFDASDAFSLASPLDDLDLQVLVDGVLIAESASTVDNIEHLSFVTDTQGEYTIRVLGTSLFGGSSEAFGLAWSSIAVPEPTSLVLLALGGLVMARRRRG